MVKANWETIRRLRLGDLKRVYRDRYGHELPDDDAGRGDLAELLRLTDPKNRRNVIDVWAPWLTEVDAECLITHVAVTGADMSPKALGDRLGLTNVERERLGIWQIAPCDLTADEFAEQKRAKKRARERERRRKKGSLSREHYLAKSFSRQKPWLAQGISRRTWERRRAKGVASPCLEQDTVDATPRSKQHKSCRNSEANKLSTSPVHLRHGSAPREIQRATRKNVVDVPTHTPEPWPDLPAFLDRSNDRTSG